MTAKRKKARTSGRAALERVSFAAAESLIAAAEPAVPILRLAAGSNLTVDVEVTNPSNDYTVQLGDTTLMFARVNRRETARNLQAGRFFLTWHFVHSNKGWAHTIKAEPDGGAAVTLDSRSEAKKDPPRSTGVALVVVS